MSSPTDAFQPSLIGIGGTMRQPSPIPEDEDDEIAFSGLGARRDTPPEKPARVGIGGAGSWGTAEDGHAPEPPSAQLRAPVARAASDIPALQDDEHDDVNRDMRTDKQGDAGEFTFSSLGAGGAPPKNHAVKAGGPPPWRVGIGGSAASGSLAGVQEDDDLGGSGSSLEENNYVFAGRRQPTRALGTAAAGRVGSAASAASAASQPGAARPASSRSFEDEYGIGGLSDSEDPALNASLEAPSDSLEGSGTPKGAKKRGNPLASGRGRGSSLAGSSLASSAGSCAIGPGSSRGSALASGGGIAKSLGGLGLGGIAGLRPKAKSGMGRAASSALGGSIDWNQAGGW